MLLFTLQFPIAMIASAINEMLLLGQPALPRLGDEQALVPPAWARSRPPPEPLRSAEICAKLGSR